MPNDIIKLYNYSSSFIRILAKIPHMKILILFFVFPVLLASSQTISGYFPYLADQEIKLKGFVGFDTYPISSTRVSPHGSFELRYSVENYGMGYLKAEDNKPFFVILSGEDIHLSGDAFSLVESIEIIKGEENLIFDQYALEHPRREQALSAWIYLQKMYEADSLFAVHNDPKKSIKKEIERIHEEDRVFLESLDPDSFVSWFLPIRKLISSVPVIAQYRSNEIPRAIDEFRRINYTDDRLYKSGLLQDVIESHFWLIENSGRSLDSVFIEMNISIDYIFNNLLSDQQKFNEIFEFLFKLLESRSLFGSSEYLALKILTEAANTLDDQLARQLETYRAMKIGNRAPDFKFSGDIFTPAYVSAEKPKKLSDINTDYTVLIFGSSTCSGCPEELSKIAALYDKWRSLSLEVIFVSLDEDKHNFNNFAVVFPFISICDYKSWDSPLAQAYHIFVTPAFYLLDKNHTIILRPNNARHLDAWVEWYLGTK